VVTFTEALQLIHRPRTAPADTGRVNLRPWVSIVSGAALVLAVPAAASAATVNVNGKGTARFQTAKFAEVIGVTVRPAGRVRLIDVDNPAAATFKPKCITRSRKACIRRDRKSGDWIVLRPVRFIYDGS